MILPALRRGLASGDWLDAQRVRAYCWLLLIASTAGLGFLVLTAHGTIDRFGRPLGTDFSDVYAAGWMANHGLAADVWAWPIHYRVQQLLHHDPNVPFYGWHYPPPFLIVAGLLALLPYLAALFVWQATTLVGAAVVATRILPGRMTVLAVIAAPVTFVCLGHGQNAFLTASLLAGGLLLLDRRPLLAGIVLGCLVYKPQFGVLLPFVLLAAGSRRAFLGAAASAIAIIALTLAIWGWPVWQAFLNSLALTQATVIGDGGTGWQKIISAFAAVRAVGLAPPAAYAVQGTVTVLTVAAAVAATRWATPAVRNAAVCCGALLSTPYAIDYDLVLLGAAIVFLVADALDRGWLQWEKSVLALGYFVPSSAARSRR